MEIDPDPLLRNEFDLPTTYSPWPIKSSTSRRKAHIRRLYDILQLCIQRRDTQRARRAWSILIRCPEVDFKDLWRIGVELLRQQDERRQHQGGRSGAGPASGDERLRGEIESLEVGPRLTYLKELQLHHPEGKEDILLEIIILLISANRHRDALDELELYLPGMPYHDNATLHEYAGMIALYLAQGSRSQPLLSRQAKDVYDPDSTVDEEGSETDDEEDQPDSLGVRLIKQSPTLCHEAKVYLSRSLDLNPESLSARTYLDLLDEATNTSESMAIDQLL